MAGKMRLRREIDNRELTIFTLDLRRRACAFRGWRNTGKLELPNLLPIYSRNWKKRCLFAIFFSTLSNPFVFCVSLNGKGVDLFASKIGLATRISSRLWSMFRFQSKQRRQSGG